MKQLLLVIGLVLTVVCTYAAQLPEDSLRICRINVSKIEASDNADDYIKLIQHFKPDFSDSIKKYVTKFEEYANLNSSSAVKAKLLFEQAYVLWRDSHLAKSQEKLSKSLTIYQTLSDSLNMALCFKRMAVNEIYASEYDKAVELSIKALKIYEKAVAKEHISDLYAYLDNCYRRLHQYDLAHEYASKNVELAKGLPDKSKLGMAYQSVASIYLHQEKDTLSEQFYLKALACYDQNNSAHASHMVSIQMNLGLIYSDFRGDHKRALKAYKAGVKHYRAIKKSHGLIYALMDQSGAENHLGNYKAADKCIAEAYKIVEETNYTRALLSVMEQESYNYKLRKDYKRAFSILKESIELNDSILSAQKVKDASEMKEKYESEKKEQEIKVLKARQEIKNLKYSQQKRGNYIMLGFIIVLLAFIGYIIKRNIERRRLNRQLKASEEQLKEMNASKDKFFSIIAHDLKNPFHSILGSSDLLINCFDSVPRNMLFQNIKNIHSAADQVYRLIENLLAWAGSQINRMKYEPASFQISYLIDDVKNAIDPIAKEKEIDVNWPAAGTTEIYADFNMLETVIRNIMSNAIKFTHTGGKVKLNFEHKIDELLITISDTGIGMDQEDADKIFLIDSKFQRDGTNDEAGSGLGLIVCKEFVDKHNGRIEVESEVDKGSCFTIILPQNMSIETTAKA